MPPSGSKRKRDDVSTSSQDLRESKSVIIVRHDPAAHPGRQFNVDDRVEWREESTHPSRQCSLSLDLSLLHSDVVTCLLLLCYQSLLLSQRCCAVLERQGNIARVSLFCVHGESEMH